MWHTSRGDRTLAGAEAALVATAIDTMIDALLIHVDESLEDSSAAECQSGISIFDSLSPSQRVGLLYDVARYLLTETDRPIPLSAPTEATVAAIFVEIRDQVAIEIDLFPDETVGEAGEPSWRGQVLAAHRALFVDPDPAALPPDFEFEPWDDERQIPEETCTDLLQWECLIESLTDAVLWDRDFEMAESFLDVDPGVSKQRRRLLGIEEDYFTSIAPDPRPEEVSGLVSRTREIVRAKPR